MNRSPYIVSNWVKDSHFYGRTELCHMLMTGYERCVYLVGTRRVGKTSVLMRLADQLSPHAIYCDLMRTAGSEYLDEARLVALMRRQLNKQAPESAALQESRAIWDQQSDSLCAWLDEVSWRWEELSLTVTLLWDEAELLRRLPDKTLMPLRAILQHSDSLRIIISGSKGVADLNDRWRSEYVSPFLFGFRTYAVAGLEDDEAEELIRQRGQVQVTDTLVETIATITGNHPFLIQTLCSKLFSWGQLREPTDQDLIVDSSMADLFRIDCSYLSPSEQHILSVIAQHGILSANDLQQHIQLPDKTIHSFIAGMRQLGLLYPADGDRWRIGNDFLAQWLRGQTLEDLSTITDRASLEVVDKELQDLAISRVAQRRRIRDLQEQNDLDADNLADNSELAHLQSNIATIDQELAHRSSVVAATNTLSPLSDREIAVVRLVAAGLSNPEIGRELAISVDTVKAHLKNISGKLGTNNRAQTVARAKEQQLI